ncbi:MAG: hypothetical protein PHN75_18695 [Syntrophales bacterium]|nr:hypothetical protein [Syntrophales bacterium]
MIRNYKLIPLAVFLIAAMLLSGCAGGTKIAVKQDSYAPTFKSGEFGRFKGKTVIMDNFMNSAANTKSWGYYSSDKKVYYEASTQLESYLWYCFQKAFQHVGMKVLDQSYGGYYPYGWWWGVPPPPPQVRPNVPKGTAEFQLVLTSMTDQECKFQVQVFKNGESKFQKEFTATMSPAATEDKGELEKRSYRMIDQMVVTVFKDRDFQKAF